MTAPSPSTLPRSAGGLIEVQRALYRRLVAVAGAPEGWGPGNGSSADAAFEVYTRSRRARLEEVLSDDYPRVRALLGADRFGALVEAYLEAHPPRDPALRNLGAQLPEFVAGGARDGCSLAQELARLEWLWVEVFDAPNEPTLDRSALMRIAPEAWPGLQLQLAEAWRIEHFGHRVETYSLEGGIRIRDPRSIV